MERPWLCVDVDLNLKDRVDWARPGGLVGLHHEKVLGRGWGWRTGSFFFGPSEKSGMTVVKIVDDSTPAFYQLVNPGENLRSRITAPQHKSGTTLVKKAGL